MNAPPSVRDAVRWLARRPLTRGELRDRLLRAGHAPDEADRAIAILERSGAVDDAKLAYEYIVTRAPRLGRGRARLIAELEGRGVDRATAEAAWRRAVELGDLEAGAAIAKAVSRRIGGGPPIDRRRYARVYNALLREGFDPEAVEAALAPYRAQLDASAESIAEREVDDLL